MGRGVECQCKTKVTQWLAFPIDGPMVAVLLLARKILEDCMSLIVETLKMLPVVAITIVVLYVGMIFGEINTHHATGLFAVLGSLSLSERLIVVGILNFVVGILMALLIAGKLHWGLR